MGESSNNETSRIGGWFLKTAFFSRSPVPPRLDLIRIVRIGLRMQKTGLGSRDRAAARSPPPPSPPTRRIQVANTRSRKMEILCPRRIRDTGFVRNLVCGLREIREKKKADKKRRQKETFRSYCRTDVTS